MALRTLLENLEKQLQEGIYEPKLDIFNPTLVAREVVKTLRKHAEIGLLQKRIIINNLNRTLQKDIYE